MVHHALYRKQNYSYAGVIEILSGAPFDVSFISYDDIRQDCGVLDGIDVILTVGDRDTAHGGGENWTDPAILEAIRAFIAGGGGFIGVGEPSACQREGRFFQLGDALGVEMERGFTLGYDKYNWDVKPHFITAESSGEIDFGEGKKNIYATSADILACRGKEVQMAARRWFGGATVYISGLPYSAENTRLLHRAVLWACGKEGELNSWFSEEPHTEIHVYPEAGRYCVVNNTDQPRETKVYAAGKSFPLRLDSGGIAWFAL